VLQNYAANYYLKMRIYVNFSGVKKTWQEVFSFSSFLWCWF